MGVGHVLIERILLAELLATMPTLVQETVGEVNVLQVLHEVALLRTGFVAEVTREVAGGLVV